VLDAIRAFLENPAGKVWVGQLHETARMAVAADAPDVFLSADTLAKQRREHPEMTASEYLLLPAVLQTPDLALQWEDLRFAVLRAGPRELVAVVKSTVERHELCVVSFRRTERKDVRRMLRKANLTLVMRRSGRAGEASQGTPHRDPACAVLRQGELHRVSTRTVDI
jgi:hypothetical protein